ncbi:hypothetical protein F3I62_00230 [Pseudomonas sp. R-28-1W-6]|uniref:hypothetical protein n=1 Tax=Pseudomonas sp. R-28-1W-6 TaxID=2650101 RepID=UPI001366613A|nr:hypothetical protein [Pseudomonas sp. R-28-1W-6]MWV10502.1 hypothetical protein [Pseudomonas sp. R-28-1W-6]
MLANSSYRRKYLRIGIAITAVFLAKSVDAPAADNLCITPPASARDLAICRLEKLRRLQDDPEQLRKASESAKRLIENGEAAMQAGNYGAAGRSFSMATAWLPSYISMLGDGDAYFTAISANPPGAPSKQASNCSIYFPQSAKMELRQTYDAALAMHDLANDETGKMPAPARLATQQKSACLHRLAERDGQHPNSCTPHQEIRHCLNIK